jgi:hypothetical protein
VPAANEYPRAGVAVKAADAFAIAKPPSLPIGTQRAAARTGPETGA